ncbi:MAG: hypothetical protein HYV97_18315 [Bdellovibrio sp.]|nr:hypothetical protein [Bdellovibrio sp.]
MIILFFLFLAIIEGQSAEALNCGEGLLIAYDSPVSGNRVESCQIKRDGKYIQHGPKIEKDKTGNVVKKEYYQNDLAVAVPDENQTKHTALAPTVKSNYFVARNLICHLNQAGKLHCNSFYKERLTRTRPLEFPIEGKITSFFREQSSFLLALEGGKLFFYDKFPYDVSLIDDFKLVQTTGWVRLDNPIAAIFRNYQFLTIVYQDASMELRRYAFQTFPSGPIGQPIPVTFKKDDFSGGITIRSVLNPANYICIISTAHQLICAPFPCKWMDEPGQSTDCALPNIEFSRRSPVYLEGIKEMTPYPWGVLKSNGEYWYAPKVHNEMEMIANIKSLQRFNSPEKISKMTHEFLLSESGKVYRYATSPEEKYFLVPFKSTVSDIAQSTSFGVMCGQVATDELQCFYDFAVDGAKKSVFEIKF